MRKFYADWERKVGRQSFRDREIAKFYTAAWEEANSPIVSKSRELAQLEEEARRNYGWDDLDDRQLSSQLREARQTRELWKQLRQGRRDAGSSVAMRMALNMLDELGNLPPEEAMARLERLEAEHPHAPRKEHLAQKIINLRKDIAKLKANGKREKA